MSVCYMKSLCFGVLFEYYFLETSVMKKFSIYFSLSKKFLLERAGTEHQIAKNENAGFLVVPSNDKLGGGRLG